MFGQRGPRALGHRPSLQQGGARGPSSPDTEGLVGGSGPTRGHPETAVSPALVPPLGLTSLTPSGEAGLLQVRKAQGRSPSRVRVTWCPVGVAESSPRTGVCFLEQHHRWPSSGADGEGWTPAQRPRVGPAARVAGPAPCEALPVRPPARGCPQPGLTMKEDKAL